MQPFPSYKVVVKRSAEGMCRGKEREANVGVFLNLHLRQQPLVSANRRILCLYFLLPPVFWAALQDIGGLWGEKG